MGNHWHPGGCGVKIATQDGEFDLADVTWQQVAPCGCVSGLTVAATDELIVTAEQAGRHFCETDREYRRDVERGFTWRPREHHAGCAEAQTSCPHDPKWGYEKPPIPEGFVWAAVHARGSRPKLTHLVPAVAVEAARNRDYSVLDVRPLCGGAKAFHWRDEWYAKSGKVECSRCITAARKVPAEAAS